MLTPSSHAQADSLLDEINATIKVLENERSTRGASDYSFKGSLVELRVSGNLVVIGDVHGDIESLHSILCDVDHQRFLRNACNKMVFLGDYIDRGSNSVDVLRTVFRLKRQYPNSVVLLCGNHEAIDQYYCATHTLPTELSSSFGEMSGLVYDRMFFLFRLLPKVAIVKDHLLLIHGGIPTSVADDRFYDAISSEGEPDKMVQEELLWNDPRSDIPDNQDWVKSRRGFGRHFGPGVTKRCLVSTKTRILVRSHEPCHGFKIDHNGMVLTLFSTKEAYPKFDAAYLLVTKQELESAKNAGQLARYIKKIKSGLTPVVGS
ncbi:metallophosphoesterase family protein [Candidatus Nitrosotenuis cloacae]|jgi:protein phosphatase|uniref:metallophosphoesterase family protein n=1 Tax=Candidatus Nitrosotenuis cloacae TaxID=1603555 RepID=UPI00227F285D|nr:metallophosphoesterase family protein [Candidatus Nitrosotenuis cloacae]